jgi:hypothetical protein
VPGPNPAGYPVQSIVWSGTATCGNCTIQLQQGLGSTEGLGLSITALGTVTITANITYGMQSNGKAPAATTATQTFTFVAPTATIVFNNPNKALGLNQQTVLQWQLQYSGLDAGGYNFTPVEKISFIQPPNTPAPYNGGWGSEPNLMVLGGNGLLNDIKGPNPDGNQTFAGNAAGSIIMQYTQVLGISYKDYCGNTLVIELGTYTVTYQMSADGSSWSCTCTPVA